MGESTPWWPDWSQVLFPPSPREVVAQMKALSTCRREILASIWSSRAGFAHSLSTHYTNSIKGSWWHGVSDVSLRQPLSSHRLKSHLEMKVSVGGWNERAARDHHAARRDAEADVKYIITRGAGKGTGTKICFGVFLSGSFHFRQFVPAPRCWCIWVKLLCFTALLPSEESHQVMADAGTEAPLPLLKRLHYTRVRKKHKKTLDIKKSFSCQLLMKNVVAFSAK